MRRARSERGSAAVEFALVLPLLLVVALALVEVGLLARDRLLVEAAARAGARAAAVETDEGAIRDEAVAAAPGLDATELTLTIARAGSRGDPVTVTIAYTDEIRVPFVGWLVGSSVGMDTSASARQEFG
ncbi:MAG: pilus assembly protein [Actinobacteria bacterium]|nr:pilus assembly protein [Actinomycetota bacterium]